MRELIVWADAGCPWSRFWPFSGEEWETTKLSRFAFESTTLHMMPAAKQSGKPFSAKPPKARPGARSLRGPLAPDRIAAILKALDEAYPNVECALTHHSPWELLVATILSAQCTDVRVNMVTPELFPNSIARQRWPGQPCPSLKP